MSQSSPVDSSSSSSSFPSPSRHAPEISRSGISCVSGGAVAPMPSLTSHPPVQRTKQQTNLVHHASHGIPRQSPPLLPTWHQSRTPSPSSSPGSSPGPSRLQQLQDYYPCPYCPQVYKKVGHLNRHVLIHTGKRFRCEVENCDKTFSRLDNMRTQWVSLPSPTNTTQLTISPFS